ncbi:hypothetical protein [Sinomonas sp. R1AF57]|uniref:hypothetical protein n=1 Tax=Sinomonas sp. R1AF57 TaxID=2020377 RepID=UPI001ABF9599|nr:hypothetical protein [Sinomonas sp. R1AF57]
MDERALVVLGGPPYQPSANQTSLQMFAEFSKSRPTLYITRRVQGVRKLLSIFDAQRKGVPVRSGLHPVGTKAHVLVLPWVFELLPSAGPSILRKISSKLIMSRAKWAVKKLKLEQPHLLAYWWAYPEVISDEAWSATGFDVIDRHWGYSYLRSGGQPAKHRDLVSASARAADFTICVSAGLAVDLMCDGDVTVVPNGVDLARIDAAKVRNMGRKRRPKTAVYIGGWNERVDFELVHWLLATHEDWKFVFGGSGEVRQFASYSNVEILGDISYDAALDVMFGASVGLIPFKATTYTDSSDLLKAADYLATGLRVAAAEIPSTRAWQARFPSLVRLARGADDWNDILGLFGAENVDPAPDMTLWSVGSRARQIHGLFSLQDGERSSAEPEIR